MSSAPRAAGSSESSPPGGGGGTRSGRSGSPTPPGSERLRFAPLGDAFAAAHDPEECGEAEEHWRRHGFGSWALLLHDETFAGVAEVHFAHPGIGGISTEEVEVGWEIVPALRGRGLATEAMRAAIADAWQRTGADHLVAYVRADNAASLRLAEKLGFAVRSEGLTRGGDPMLVLELRREGASEQARSLLGGGSPMDRHRRVTELRKGPHDER